MIRQREALAAAKARLAASGVDEPDLSAELLLAFVLGKDRSFFFREPEFELSRANEEHFQRLLERRQERWPVAYLLGEQEFFGLRFEVSPSVLIPRPETEQLVERALELLQEISRSPRVLDVGTGSGCIAVAIAKRDPRILVTALDRSEPALHVARRNAIRNGVARRIQFLASHLLESLREEPCFDLVISNPPYIDPAERPSLMPEVRDFEPASALFAPQGHPTFFHGEIARQAASRLRPEGKLLLELGAGQSSAAVGEVRLRGYDPVVCRRDYQGIERILEAALVS